MFGIEASTSPTNLNVKLPRLPQNSGSGYASGRVGTEVESNSKSNLMMKSYGSRKMSRENDS